MWGREEMVDINRSCARVDGGSVSSDRVTRRVVGKQGPGNDKLLHNKVADYHHCRDIASHRS
jgi:hypothetical protein